MKRNESKLMSTEVNLAALLTGLQAKLAPGTEILVSSVKYSRDDLAKIVEAYLGRYKSAREARVVAAQEAHDRDTAHPQVRELLLNVHEALNQMYGATSAELLGFGFQPKKKRSAPTFDEKVARAAKARATRAKNHPSSPSTGDASKP